MRLPLRLIAASLLVLPVAAFADVRGPEGDHGFRYVYPVNASPSQAAKLHREDLKAIASEESKLAAGDGGTLTADHRAYLDTRRAVVEQRYAEAIGQTAALDR